MGTYKKDLESVLNTYNKNKNIQVLQDSEGSTDGGVSTVASSVGEPSTPMVHDNPPIIKTNGYQLELEKQLKKDK
jgi:hypothetical protein